MQIAFFAYSGLPVYGSSKSSNVFFEETCWDWETIILLVTEKWIWTWMCCHTRHINYVISVLELRKTTSSLPLYEFYISWVLEWWTWKGYLALAFLEANNGATKLPQGLLLCALGNMYVALSLWFKLDIWGRYVWVKRP